MGAVLSLFWTTLLNVGVAVLPFWLTLCVGFLLGAVWKGIHS